MLPDRALKMISNAYGFEVSNADAAMMRIPNGPKAMFAYGWMDRIFKLIGDVQPNSDKIHLEAMSICFASLVSVDSLF